jgi:uncharacterized protein (TIGR02246 family)
MRIAIAASTLLMLSACTFNIVSDGAPAARDREISDATARWVEAYNSRDPVRIVAQYDGDAVLLGTTSTTLRATPAEVLEYFKDSPKRPDARVSIVEQHIRVGGELASNTGLYTFTDVRDGKPTANPARFTLVFARRGGQWIIASHHSSRVPAAP